MTTPPGTDGPARRTRVVLGDAARRTRSTDRTRADLAEQTPVGEALVRGLVRAQLALALRLLAVLVTLLGGLPLLFALVPATRTAQVLGLPLPWLALGVLVYPALLAAGLLHVRLAERHERDFVDLVERS